MKMAPVKKAKTNNNKSIKIIKKPEKKVEIADESVISGQLQKKIHKKQKKPQKDPKGVVFIKHLPHGFFEEQLKKYFEQFGNVTRVRLARSRRTGNSKGYAFVEFEYPEVAEVAAQTMDNYLMFKQIIKASYIPPEKQQFNYFRTSLKQIRNKSGKTVWVSGRTASIQQKMKKHNDWSEENYQKRTKKQLIKLKKIAEKYAYLGIDINEIIVQPKIITEKEKKLREKSSKVNVANKENPIDGSNAMKRKPQREDVPPNKQISKKSKLKVSLEDLLGNTLQEDTEDEDYIAMGDSEDGSEENEESSDETYGFAKDSDNETEQQNDSENESGEEEPQIAQQKLKKNFGKSLKVSNVERVDQILKRKPQTGGIKKINKKPLKKAPVVAKKKGALQITAAKELAKPLSKVKSKLNKKNKPLKTKKN